MISHACKTVEPQTEIVTILETKYVYPSDSLLIKCPEQKPFEIQTNGELLMSLIDLSTNYAICSARMQSVITYVLSIKEMTESFKHNELNELNGNAERLNDELNK